MTVSSSISKQLHLTNEAVAIYSFPFKVFKASEVSVSVLDPAQPQAAALTLAQDYEVMGLNEDSGGQILLSQAGIIKAGAGRHLIILRSMPFTQEVDYRPHDIFPAETHERALDIAAMERQELREKIGRAVLAPPDMDSAICYRDFQTLHDETASAAGSAAGDRLKAEDAAARAEAAAGTAAGEAALPASVEELQNGELKGKYVSPWAMAKRSPKFLYEDAVGKTLETPAASQERADAALQAAKDYFNEYGVPDASAAVKGKVMLAATNDATSTSKAATPAGVAAQVAAAGSKTNSVLLTSSGSWKPPKTGLYTFILIGGGGASGNRNPSPGAGAAGGGGAGGCRSFIAEIKSLDPIPVKIGAGGAAPTAINADKGGGGGGATLITINGATQGVGGGGGGGFGANISIFGGGGGAGGPIITTDTAGESGGGSINPNGGAGSGYQAGAPGEAVAGNVGGPSANSTGGTGGSPDTPGRGGSIYGALCGDYGRGADAPSSPGTLGKAGRQGCIQIFW